MKVDYSAADGYLVVEYLFANVKFRQETGNSVHAHGRAQGRIGSVHANENTKIQSTAEIGKSDEILILIISNNFILHYL